MTNQLKISASAPQKEIISSVFNTLPSGVRALILQSGITYGISSGKLRFSAGNRVDLPEFVLEEDSRNWLSAYLFSTGIHKAAAPEVTDETLDGAFDEHVKNMFERLRLRGDIQAEELEIIKEKFKQRQSREFEICDIVAGAYVEYESNQQIIEKTPHRGRMLYTFMEAVLTKKIVTDMQRSYGSYQSDMPIIRKPDDHNLTEHDKQSETAFCRDYEGWQDWIKALIQAHGVTFVLSGQLADNEQMYDPIRKEVKLVAEDIASNRSDKHTTPMFAALLSIMPPHEISQADWKKAQEEILLTTVLRLEGHAEQQLIDHANILAIAHRVMGINFNQFINVWPETTKLYSQFIFKMKSRYEELHDHVWKYDESDIPRLQAASDELQGKFRNAFKELPAYVQYAIIKNKLQFKYDPNAHIGIDDGISVISEYYTRSPFAMKTGLTVLGLVQSIDVVMTEGERKAAIKLLARSWQKDSDARALGTQVFTSATTDEIKLRMRKYSNASLAVLLMCGEHDPKVAADPLFAKITERCHDAAKKEFAKAQSGIVKSLPASQELGDNDIPLMHGATDFIQQQFDTAFRLVPPHIQHAILKHGIQFAYHGETPLIYEIKEKVTFGFSEAFTFKPKLLAQMISACGLAQCFDLGSNDLWLKARQEQLMLYTKDPRKRDKALEYLRLLKDVPINVHIYEKKPLLADYLKEAAYPKDSDTGAIQEICRLYRDEAHKQFDADMAAGHGKVTSSDFRINASVLTSPQQQYFKQLNELIGILGVSAAEFDSQFKASVISEAWISDWERIKSEAEECLRVVHDKKLKAEFKEGLGWPHELGAMPYQAPERRMGAYKQNINKMDVLRNISSSVYEGRERLIGLLAPSFECVPPSLAGNTSGGQGLEDSVTEPDLVKHVQKYSAIADFKLKHGLILQRIASGRWKFDDFKDKTHGFSTDLASYKMPTEGERVRCGVLNAALKIAEEKHITGEQLGQVKEKIQQLEEIWPHMVMTPAQIAKMNEDREIEQMKLEREARNIQERSERDARESLIAKPYKVPECIPITLTEESGLLQQEVRRLADLLDCRDEANKKLGDLLLSGPILQVIESDIGGRVNVVKALLEKDKGVRAALPVAQVAVEELFDPTLERYEANAAMRDALLQSPILLAIYMGRSSLIMAAKVIARDGAELLSDGPAYIHGELENLLNPHWKTLRNRLFPEQTVYDVLSQPDTPVAAIAPVVEVTPEITIVSQTPDMPPTPAGSTFTPQPAESVPEIIMQDNPSVPLAELEARRTQAYEAMMGQLKDAAAGLGVQAIEDGYNQFRCDLLLNENNARIRILFKSDDHHKPPRIEIFDLNSRRFEGGYARLGVVPTSLDALNLRIAMNAEINGDGDFLPILSKTASGMVRISINDFIPSRAIHPDERSVQLKINNKDLYQMELTSRFTKRGDDVTMIFPLGVKAHDDLGEISDDAWRIADNRMRSMISFIDEYNAGLKERRKIPVKGEIQSHLENEVLALRNADPANPEGHWAVPERIRLLDTTFLEHHYLLQTDPAYVELAERWPRTAEDMVAMKDAQQSIPRIISITEDDEWQYWANALAECGQDKYRKFGISIPTLDSQGVAGPQYTTLGALALSNQGTNRTYHLSFTLYVNDNPEDKKSGYSIRGRHINMCVDDPETARARAQEVFYGNTEKNTQGFMELLDNYFAHRPQARWCLEHKPGFEIEENKKRIKNSLEHEVTAIVGPEILSAYRKMIRNELPPRDHTRRLHVTRSIGQFGVVGVCVQVQQEKPVQEGSQIKEYEVAKDKNGQHAELTFTVPANKADLVEKFARGDMDYERITVLLRDHIPRYEHDLCVRYEHGEPENGMVPVTFSVMRGKRDHMLEQHLNSKGQPLRITVQIPESAQHKIAGFADIVDRHLSLLAAVHYSPIMPNKPFARMKFDELKEFVAQQKRGDFTEQAHPEFLPDNPKAWLNHAIHSNWMYHFEDIVPPENVKPCKRNGSKLNGAYYGKHDRVPEGLFDAEVPYIDRIRANGNSERGL